ncbi:hypothetical protein OpiT1DRAFT_04352 [Opitutaceae bacterium TAV1]|nr:hypothetical protein OpiT1DRAFT_04352 [Opitutaceae bacterium TAV1]
MKLTLDTISAPVRGKRATQLVHAMRSGRGLMNAKGKAFVASLLTEARPPRTVSVKTRQPRAKA